MEATEEVLAEAERRAGQELEMTGVCMCARK